MTGEMGWIHPRTGTEPDGTVWTVHAAICRALRRRGLDATIQPFDQYQGPYVRVGSVRLWVTEDSTFTHSIIYREDTGGRAHYHPWKQGSAVKAALRLMRLGGLRP